MATIKSVHMEYVQNLDQTYKPNSYLKTKLSYVVGEIKLDHLNPHSCFRQQPFQPSNEAPEHNQ